MALIISDRVKETTVTQGTGTISLSGNTFGGFQSFSTAVGEGNTTYYCIQNESNFEIGLGTFSSGSLSRDTVIESSNSNAKISIAGVALVFGVVPASKLIYKNANDNFTTSGDASVNKLTSDYVLANSGDFNGPVSTQALSSTNFIASSIISNGELGVSGLITLRRESAGSFFHAYIDDLNDRTICLHSDGVSPIWSLGLKNSFSDEEESPSFGYVSAGDSHLALVGSEDNKITLSNVGSFCVTHQGVNIINAHYMMGVHLNSISSSYPALVVNGGAALSANIQEWDSYSGTTLSVVDNEGNFGVRNSNPSYQLDVTGTGNFSQAIRFGDGSIQTTAGLPSGSGSLIDQSIVSNSGYFQTHINNVSGELQSQITDNDVSNFNQVARFNSGVKTAINTEADAATITFDMDQSNVHMATLGGDRTLAVSNVDVGQKFSIRLQQDNTGSRTVVWWDGIKWAEGGTEPTLTAGGDKADLFSFLSPSGGYYDGFVVGQNI